MSRELPALTESGVAQLLHEAMDSVAPGRRELEHPALTLAARHGYLPTSLIAVGGTAEVWRGIDQNTGRDIAIKVPIPDSSHAAPSLDREAEALARLSPPSVAALIRRGGQGLESYLVIEFIDGLDGESALPNGAGVSDVLRTMIAICNAVEQVHRGGVVHGDLKHSNTLMRPEGSAVLIDFGLAAWADVRDDRLAGIQATGGTRRFLAPEIADRSRPMPTVASDVYALGAMLVHLVEARALQLGSSITDIVERATAADPAGRFACVEDMTSALRRELVRSAARPRSIRRAARTLAAVLVVGIIITGAAVLNHRQGVTTPTDLQTVAAQLQAGGGDAALQALGRVPEADRGWEWRHLWHEATTPPAVRKTIFPPTVMAASIAPGADRFLVTDSGGVTMLVDGAGTREKLYEHAALPGHTLALHDAWVCAYADGHIVRIDRAGHDRITSGHFAGGQPAVCWGGPRGRVQLFAYPEGQIWSVALSTGESELVGPADIVLHASTARDWVLRGIEHDDGGYEAVIGGPDLATRFSAPLASDEHPMSVDVDPVGAVAAVGLSTGEVLILGLGTDGPMRRQTPGASAVTAVVVDRADDRLFAAGEQLWVYRLSDGHLLLTLPISIPGVTRDIRWERATGVLTLATDRGAIQWAASPAGRVASR